MDLQSLPNSLQVPQGYRKAFALNRNCSYIEWVMGHVFTRIFQGLALPPLLLLLPNFTLNAQIVISGQIDANTAVQDVLVAGECLQVQNITFAGRPAQLGQFTGGGFMGLNEGLVLSTGQLNDIEGPNIGSGFADPTGASTDLNGPNVSDTDIEQISDSGGIFGPDPSYDCAILEFDFKPLSDVVTFNYAFGSEEYPEYVNANVNDGFGFFLSGPGINGPFSNNSTNVALIPGTNANVTIDDVNAGVNTTYYLSNPNNSANSEYDGFAYGGAGNPLVATLSGLTPCEWYHIKLAVCDIGDGIFDSGVFLGANSFVAGIPAVATSAVPNSISQTASAYEGCEDGFFYIEIPVQPEPTLLTFTVNDVPGVTDAAIGTDYYLEFNGTNLGNGPDFSITLPAGETVAEILVVGISDGIVELSEIIEVQVTIADCDCMFPDPAQLEIYDSDETYVAENNGDVTICPGESFLAFDFVGGSAFPPYQFEYTDQTGAVLSSGTALGPVGYLPPGYDYLTGVYIDNVTTNTTLTATFIDECGRETEVVTNIIVSDTVDPTITDIPPICQADAAPLVLQAAGSGGVWSGPGITDVDLGTWDPTVAAASGPGPYAITYEINNSCGSESDDTEIAIIAGGDPTLTPAGPFCSDDSPVQIIADQPGGTWVGPGVDATGMFDPAAAGSGSHNIVYDTNAGGCGGQDQITIVVEAAPIGDPYAETICEGIAFTYTPTTNIVGTTFTWDGDNGTSGTGDISDTPLLADSPITYTVTPTVAGSSCPGDPFEVVLTVTAPGLPLTEGPFEVCAEQAFTYTPPGTVSSYTWSGTNGTNGTDSGITYVTNVPETVTYTITPTSISPTDCPPPPYDIELTVLPIPEFMDGSGEICPGESFTYDLSDPGVSFSWTGDNGSIGSGSINDTPADGLTTVTYTVLPTLDPVAPSTLACLGAPFQVILTIGTEPSGSDDSAEICDGATFDYTFVPVVAGTVFNWDDGNGNTGTGDISTTPTGLTSVTYTVTPTLPPPSTCQGEPFEVLLNINPSPVGTPDSDEICEGMAFSFTPQSDTPGATFSWSGDNGSSGSGDINDTPSSEGTVVYTVIPTGPAPTSCEGPPFEITLTVQPVPEGTPDVGEICLEEQFSFTPSADIAGTTFEWTGSNATSGTGDIIDTPLTAGTVTYSVTPTAPAPGACPGLPFDIVLTVTALPMGTPGMGQICTGGTFDYPLTADIAGTTFSWSGDNGTSGTGDISDAPVGPTTVIYTVSPIGPTNCVGPDFEVELSLIDAVTGTPDVGTICEGESFSFSPVADTAGSTFTWQGDNGSSGTGDITDTPTTPGTVTYTVTPTGPPPEACPGVDFDIVLTVNPSPIGQPDTGTICLEEEFIITPTADVAGTTFTWSGSNGTTGTGDIIDTPGTAGTITYTVTPTAPAPGLCEGDPFEIVLSVDPLPLGSPDSGDICDGETFTFTPVVDLPGATVSWVGDNGSSGTGDITDTPNGASAVTYTVTPISDANCPGPDFEISLLINISPVGVPDFGEICEGETFTLDPQSDIPGTTFEWSGDNGTSGSGTISDSPVDIPTVVYTITPTGPAPTSCQGQPFEVLLTVNPTPIGEPASEGLCIGQSFSYNPTSDDPNATYSWTSSTGISGDGPISDVTVGGGVATIFTVIPTGAAPGLCEGEPFEISLVAYEAPIGNPLVEGICEGESISILPTASLAGTSYSWTGDNGTSGFGLIDDTPGSNVIYTVLPEGPGPGYCVGEPFEIAVSVDPEPIGEPGTGTVCVNEQFDFTPVANIDGTTFSWSGSNGSSGTGDISDVPTTEGTVTYTVTPTGPDPSACPGQPFEVVLTVLPSPIGEPGDDAICEGEAFSFIVSADTPGTTFEWTGDNGSVGSGNIDDVPVAAGTVIYSITPTGPAPELCPGEPFQVSLVIEPLPIGILDIGEVCEGDQFDFEPQADIPGASFNWTGDNGTSGSGNIIDSPTGVTSVVYTVTPFSPAPADCEGLPFEVILTVLEAPIGTPESGVVCDGESFTYSPITDIPGSTFEWIGSNGTSGTGDISDTPTGVSEVSYQIIPTGPPPVSCLGQPFDYVVTVNPLPVGTPDAASICLGESFEITPIADLAGAVLEWSGDNGTSGVGDIIDLPAAEGTITYTVVPTSADPDNCPGEPFDITLEVDPLPIGTPDEQEVCANQPFQYSPQTDLAGTTFTWSGDNGSSGIGDIDDIPEGQGSVTYTIIPISADPALCEGEAFEVTVNINQYPSGFPSEEEVCEGQEFSFLPNSSVDGTTFTWEGDNGSSGVGEIIDSPTGVDQVIYTVTPVGPDPLNCPGNPFPLTLNVSPAPMGVEDDFYVCEGEQVTYTPQADIDGTTFEWTGDNGSAGTGDIIDVPLGVPAVIYTVTPVGPEPGLCPGDPFQVIVGVISPPIGNPETLDICAGETVDYNPISSDPNAQYIWEGDNGTLGELFIFDTPDIEQSDVVLYIITPYSAEPESCEGIPFELLVFISPAPVGVEDEAIVCEGDVFEYEPTSDVEDASYSWTGDNGSSGTGAIFDSPGDAGEVIYTVIPTGAEPSACEGEPFTISLTVQAAPIGVAGEGLICEGEDFSFQPESDIPGSSFEWVGDNGSSGTDEIVDSPDGSGTITYTVTPTGPAPDNCPGEAFEVTLTVNPTPEAPEVLDPDPTCLGDEAPTVTASGAGGSFTWFDGDPESGASEISSQITLEPGDNNVVDTSVEGTYSVWVLVTDEAGCVGPATEVIFEVLAAPDAEASNEGPYCEGEAIALSGSSTAEGSIIEYQWTGPSNFSSTAQNPANATEAGTYELIVLVDGCPSEPVSTIVETRESPIATAAYGGPYCEDQQIDLTGTSSITSGDVQFEWTGPGYSSSDQNPSDATEAGTYTLIVTVDDCPSEPATVEVELLDPPQSIADNTGPFCEGEAIIITGDTDLSGDIQYSWTGPNNYSSSEQNPTEAIDEGDYSLTVTVNGCESEIATTTIVINPEPVASFIIAPVEVCADGTDSVTVTFDGTVQDPSAASFVWDFGGGNANPGAGIGPHEVSWPGGEGPASISLSITENECQSDEYTDQVQLSAPIDPPNITCSSTINSVSFEWSTVEGADSYDVQVYINGSSQSSSNTTDTSLTVSDLSEGDEVAIEIVAVASADNACGNSELSSESCTADNCPAIVIVPDLPTDLCISDAPVAIVVDPAGTTFTGPGVTAVQFDPAAAGTGTHQIDFAFADVSGCEYEDSFTITVNPDPTADFTVDPSTVCGDGSTVATVSFTGNAGPAASFDWDWAGGTAVPLGAQVYEVSWLSTNATETISLSIDENACTAENTAQIAIAQPLVAPSVSCESTTTSVSFAWDATTGASGYQVLISVDGATATTAADYDGSSTNYELSGLPLGSPTTVEITVIATGPEPCGDSEPASTACTTGDCPSNPITMDLPEDFCEDATAIDISSLIGPDGAVATGDGINGSTLFAEGLDAGGPYTITVNYTDPTTGCEYESQHQFTLATVPLADAGASVLLTCQDEAVTLDGSGSSQGGEFAYSWDGPAIEIGGSTLTPSVSQAGLYTLTVVNTTNDACVATAQVEVTQDLNAPIADAGANQQLTCSTTDVTLDGSASASGPNIQIAWSGPGITAENETALMPVVEQVGVYTIEVTDTDNGCVATAQVEVTQDASLPVADAGPQQTLTCTTTEVVLDGSASSMGADILVLWEGPGIDASNETQISPAVTSEGTYTLTITNISNNCIATQSVEVITSADIPSADAGADQTITCQTTSVVLDGSASSGGLNLSYLWEGPGVDAGTETEAVATATSPGVYTLTVTNNDNGCIDSDEISIDQDGDLPTANAGADAELTCILTEIELDGSGSDAGPEITYTWTGPAINPANSFLQNPTVDEAGTYTIEVYNAANGCISFDSVEITQDAGVPVADAGPAQAIDCTQTSAILDAAASSSGAEIIYEWEGPGITPANANQQNPEVTTAGDYTLTVTNTTNNCTATSTVSVTEDLSIPLVDAGEDQFITCQQSEVTLGGTASTDPNLSYNWEGPGIDASNVDSPNPVVSSGGTYTLTILNTANNCTDSDSVEVGQDADLPSAAAGANQQLTCQVLSVTLDASASTSGDQITYTWTGPGITAANANEVQPEVSEAGVYTLTIFDAANGCEATATVEVTQDAGLPVADAGPEMTLNCEISEVTLDGSNSTSSPDISVEWTGPGITAANANELSPTVSEAGNYVLTITNTANNCTATSTVDVGTSTAAPLADAGDDQTITCEVSTVTLDASASSSGDEYTYTWEGPGIDAANANEQNPEVSASGEYILTVTNIDNACTASSTVEVSQDAGVPLANAGDDQQLTCDITEIQLFGAGSSSGPTITYTWVGPGITSANQNEANPIVDQTGSYTLTVFDSANGCTASDIAEVLQDASVPAADAGDNQALGCELTNAELGGPDSSTGENISYDWEGPGITATNADDQFPVVNQAGTYTLTVTNTDNNCSATSSVEVLSDDLLPEANAGADQTLTCETEAVILDATASTSGDGIIYSWTGPGISTANESEQSPEVAVSGIYILTVTNINNGCSSTDEVEVLQDGDFPNANAGEDQLLTCDITEVTLDGSASDSGMIYSWEGPGINPENVNEQNPTVDQTGSYTLTVLNEANGCSAQDIVEVSQDAGVPVADAGQTQTLGCEIANTEIGGEGSSTGPNITYSWEGPGINASNETDQFPTVDAAGEYSLTVTNTDNNCEAVATVIVNTDDQLPIADAGPDQTLTCDIEAVTLDASGSSEEEGMVYLWTGPGISSDNEAEQNPQVSISGEYTLTVINTNNGCESSDLVEVLQDGDFPAADAGPDQQLTCEITEVILDASGSESGMTYFWEGPGIGATNSNEQNPTVTQTGVYTLTVLNEANGCASSDIVEVTQDAGVPTADVGAEQTFDCQTAELTIGGVDTSTGDNFTYEWQGPGITAGNANELNPTVSEPGIYTLTVTNTDNNCTAESSVELLSNDIAPNADAGQPANITCTVQQVQLDGSASDSGENITYIWEGPGITAANENEQSPTVAIQGIYTITVTNNDNGCAQSATVEVDQDGDFPLADAGADTQLTCETLEVTLDGSASESGDDISYSWEGPGITAANENELNPSVGQAGQYTITVSNNANGCSSSDVVEVGQDAGVPIADAGEPQQLNCTLEEVTLNGTSTSIGDEFTYEWTGPGITTDNANQLNPIVSMAGEYILQVTNTDNDCTATASVNISEDTEQPIADAGPSMQITCQQSSVTLDGSASSSGADISYQWTGPGITTDNEDQISPEVNAAGEYILTVFNESNNCSESASVTITADENIPIASAGLPQTLDCTGDPVMLDGSASSSGPEFTYQWTGPGINEENAEELNPLVALSGSYTLTVINTTNDCEAEATVEVSADINAPNADAGPDMTLICEEGPISLDASGSDNGPGITYEWSGPGLLQDGSQNTLAPNVELEGTYILSVFNANNGCSNTDEVLVVLECDCVPAADPEGDNQSYCEGTAVPSLSVVDNGVDTYNWYETDISAAVIATGPSYSPGQPGTYWVQAFTADPENCPSPNRIPLTITEIPADDASFTLPALVYCTSEGPIVPAIIGTPGGTFASNGSIPIDTNTGVIDIANAASESFDIWYLTNSACPDSTGVSVQIIEDPGATVFMQAEACLDDIVLIEAQTSASPEATYQWNLTGDYQLLSGQLDSPGPLEVSWSEAGLQEATLTISDASCLVSSTASIDIIQLEATINGLTAILSGETSQLEVSVTGASSTNLTYEWSPAEGLSCTDCANPIASPEEDTTYTVTVTDEVGCEATASISIEVFREPIVIIPNAFSPNGDGLNDSFFPITNFAQEVEFYVYDRWGKLLYTGSSLEDKWDGTYKGELVTLNVYVYYARVLFTNGQENFYKGNVTVVY